MLHLDTSLLMSWSRTAGWRAYVAWCYFGRRGRPSAGRCWYWLSSRVAPTKARAFQTRLASPEKSGLQLSISPKREEQCIVVLRSQCGMVDVALDHRRRADGHGRLARSVLVHRFKCRWHAGSLRGIGSECDSWAVRV